MASRNITELSGVEFTGSLGEAFLLYGQELAALADRWGTELDIATVDAHAAMSTMKGRWYWFGLDVELKARKVATRLRRARELVAALEDQAARLPRTYIKQFGGHNRPDEEGDS